LKLVVALGGNALLRRSQPPTAANQLANLRVAVSQLARLAGSHDMVLTHGNGPQVGLLALQSAAYTAVDSYPLDVLDAESEGMLGYLLEQELANLLPPSRSVVSILTRVEVDAGDAAFSHPSKPIGPVYTAEQAQQAAAAHGWVMGADGSGRRRLVASPAPINVLCMRAIDCLLAQGALVIAAGGGGIPVVKKPGGVGFQGVEAVIDKDLCSALIATNIQADCLLIATDVAGIFLNWGLPTQRLLLKSTPQELLAHDFASGSMAPKVAAACAFVRATKRRAVIGDLKHIEAMLAGTAGTQIS